MELPDQDEEFLKTKGYRWELDPDGAGASLIISEYRVNGEVYDRAATNLMIRLPGQYNLAGLDMFYVDPPLRLKNGTYPKAADLFETHAERQWQRFSRHLPIAWRPGIDGLQMFFALIGQELQGGKQPS
jgi:hypothetical protein